MKISTIRKELEILLIHVKALEEGLCVPKMKRDGDTTTLRQRQMSYAITRLDPMRKRIEEMLRAGQGLVAISAICNISRNYMGMYVANVLHAVKIMNRGWVFLTPEQHNVYRNSNLMKWIQEQYSPVSIAKELEVDVEVVESVAELRKLYYNKKARKWNHIDS